MGGSTAPVALIKPSGRTLLALGSLAAHGVRICGLLFAHWLPSIAKTFGFI
jgi:hypothetical protein